MCSSDVLGLSGMFCLYGTTAVLAAVFFYFMLPETKGKTLEDIDRELRLNRLELFIKMIQIHCPPPPKKNLGTINTRRYLQ